MKNLNFITIVLTLIFNYTFAYALSINEEISPKSNKRESKKEESKDYDSHTIGGVTFMTKNLDVSTFRDGTEINQAKNNEEWLSYLSKEQPAWCYYNYDKKNDKKYGKLYNYYAIIHEKKLAPEGWHIPNIYEMYLSQKEYYYSEIPNEVFQDSFKLKLTDNLCYPKAVRLNTKNKLIELASSTFSIDGNFEKGPYSIWRSWEGSWWTNTTLEASNKVYPIALYVTSSIEIDDVNADFIKSSIKNGRSVICFKDYPNNTKKDSTEIQISNSSIYPDFKKIDSIQNLTSQTLYIYSYKNHIYSDLSTFPNSNIKIYTKWASAQAFEKKIEIQDFIKESLKSNFNLLFCGKLRKYYNTPNNQINSLLDSIEIAIDVTAFSERKNLVFSFDDLNIKYDLNSNSELAIIKVDSILSDLIFDKLKMENLTDGWKQTILPAKILNFSIKNKKDYKFFMEKEFIGNYQNCSYLLHRNIKLDLTNKIEINFAKVNEIVHKSLLINLERQMSLGQYISAINNYSSFINKLPVYIKSDMNKWHPLINHENTFLENIKLSVKNLSSNQKEFIDAYKKANTKEKLLIKKLYYMYGENSKEISDFFINNLLNNYDDYLIVALIYSNIYENQNRKIPIYFYEFDYSKPYSPIYPALDNFYCDFFPKESSLKSLLYVNKAISINPNESLGYIYKTLFTQPTSLKEYNDPCTYSEYCINCKDLKRAVNLDNQNTLIPEDEWEDRKWKSMNPNSKYYFHQIYIQCCVKCDLCHYNVCGGQNKNIQTGNRGGKYYINSNGNKTYIK